MKQPVYQKGELLSPEELRKVGSLPLHIKGAGWEDDQTADDCQTWDGEHQTANISFDQKQQLLGKRETTKANTISQTALEKRRNTSGQHQMARSKNSQMPSIPWIIEVDHLLGDHLIVDCSLQSVREQADDVLLDLIL